MRTMRDLLAITTLAVPMIVSCNLGAGVMAEHATDKNLSEAERTEIIRDLESSEFDDQQRAARRLYRDHADRLPDDVAIVKALRESVQRGNTSAAALLLLGYCRSTDTEQALRTVLETRGNAMTKLNDWSRPVPVAVPCHTALSRLGDPASRRKLIEFCDQAQTDVLLFQLEAIREVDDPTVLRALMSALDCTEEIATGVPSGASPRRRVRDVAADALAGRLQLEREFTIKPSQRYEDREIASLKALIDMKIPH